MSDHPEVTEKERASLEVAEDAREQEWTNRSFMRELFLGKFSLGLIHPFPGTGQWSAEFIEFRDKLARFIEDDVDSAAIDESGEYPPEVVDALRKMGAFGMKVPKEYGGLGFNQAEYSQIMELLGSVDGNLSALLSAHQSIGVPQPLKMFGTKELKSKYLPRCAAGSISAFALTEDSVGSDPSALETTAELTPEGDAYILNGRKLWCTNGTIAELLVVMARDPKKKRKISAFVVEMEWPGVTVDYRCRFMGLRALANAVISFDNVRIPKENLIGKEGAGLKIALVTLNTGRLSLPAGAVGSVKKALKICREWAGEREQWGLPIGKHEAIAHKLADMAATTFAMESVSNLASGMADRGGYDIRLEAAAAKEWCSVEGWRLVDATMQIRGGRGYETERSLAGRGEKVTAVERMMRDSRINMIFEGSSEIMHLFMAREAVDKHLQVAGDIINPKKSIGKKLAALPKIGMFYATWYPSRWLGWGRWPRYSEFGSLARHLRFVERKSRKLSRQVFHGMMVHQAKLQRKQAFLFRIVDIANELLAMAASITRVHAMIKAGQADRIFKDLWNNDDVALYGAARDVLSGKHTWVEEGIVESTLKDVPAKAESEAEQIPVS